MSVRTHERLVLLSGGLDSATAARETGATIAMFVDYQQPALSAEVMAAARVVHALDMDMLVTRINNFYFDIGEGVIPARNAMLLSLAISTAKQTGCRYVVHGATRSDHARFGDCRREFFDIFRQIASPWGVEIETPLIDLTRPEVEMLGFPRHLVWSCYTPGPEPCGRCLSCLQ